MSTPSTRMGCCWTRNPSRDTCPRRRRRTQPPSPRPIWCCSASSRPIPRKPAGRSVGCLRPETSVLSLQNGVDNPQRLRKVTGHPVIPVVVYVGSEMAGPGHVRHHGGGDLAIGAAPESEALAQTLEAAGIRTTIADDIEVTLWSKLVINCAYNALSAVAGISYGPMLEVEGTRDVVASAVQEAVMVARASGVSMPEDILERILKIPAAMPNQMSSTAQDRGARQAQRDRLSQRLCGAQGRRARRSHADQSGPAGDGEAGGTTQRDVPEPQGGLANASFRSKTTENRQIYASLASHQTDGG